MADSMTQGIVWVPLLAELDADSAVDWLVAGIPALLALGGMIKCVQIARRNTSSTACVVSLALVLLSVEIYALSALAAMAGYEGAMRAIATRSAGGFAAIGAIVAIIGLLGYRRAKPPYIVGVPQAIFAVVLAVALTGWQGFKGRTDGESDTVTAALLGLIGRGDAQVLEEFNLRFDSPPAGWLSLDPQMINEDACIAYNQLGTEVFFILIAERAGVEFAMTSEELADIAQANMTALDPNAKIGTRKNIRHAGIEGLAFQSVAKSDFQRFCYDHRVFAHNGYSYQLVTFAEQGNRRQVERAARTMLRCFDQIDRTRKTHADDTRLIEKHVSHRYGYEVDLSGEAWFTTDDIESAYEYEDMIAVYREECWLTVIAIGLDDATAPDEALLKGMLALKEHAYPGSPIHGRSTSNANGRREITFYYEFEDEEGTNYRALCRLVRAKGVVYLFQAAYDKSSEEGRARAEAVLQRVHVTEPVKPVSEIESLPRETRTQARFYNHVGLHFYENAAYDRAQRWFAGANALDDTRVSYVRNVTLCLMKRDRNAEALMLLNRNLDLIEDSLGLRGDRAYLLAVEGKLDAAEREYATIFARGLRDDEDLEYYAGMLVDADRVDDAKRLIDEYRRVDDSPALVAIHARVLMRAKLLAEARSLLEEQPKPRAAVIRYALVGVLEKLAEHEQALVVAVSLLADGYDSAWTYRAKARQEIALKRYDEACKTLDLAEAKYGQDEQIKKLREAARK